MVIRPKFKAGDIMRAMENRHAHAERLIIRNLSYVGEHAITIAREAHTDDYTDRTGNLRASVGYVIVKDGNIVFSGGFDPAAASKRTDGETGAKEGRTFADQLAKRYMKGFVLIIVAGMFYGTYVEKNEYNVVTFTKIEAEKMSKVMMRNFSLDF